MDGPLSSSLGDLSNAEQTIAHYKTQYEQLEQELQEFQASSQDLERELERDVEAAEKRETALLEKVDALGFEVEEWKTKYRQSKNEAGTAQGTLQKEITTLRDSNRTLQLKLRDIEVVNDDFERQARNTSSSLEDIEAKYNIAIERAVLMDEEIKIGEQERETLRIETQRLRDELSDLKIEAEITQDKLRKRQLTPIETLLTVPDSPSSTASSPLVTTPPDTKSVSTTDTVSPTHTPPSPPMSDASAPMRTTIKTPKNAPNSRFNLPCSGSSAMPKPSLRYPSGKGPTSAFPRIAQGKIATPSLIRNTRAKAQPTRGLPKSNSIAHLQDLADKMQELKNKVHFAMSNLPPTSRLPAPIKTPPQVSPGNRSAMEPHMEPHMPPSVTIKRGSTKGGTATTSSSLAGGDTPASPKYGSRVSTSGISRLSFGPVKECSLPVDEFSRPSSQASTNMCHPISHPVSRPVSRLNRPASSASRTEIVRPPSRTTVSRSETPLPQQVTNTRKTRSGIGGSYHCHGQSQSVSNIDGQKTPSCRGSTISNAQTALPRRQSGGFVSSAAAPRRTSSGTDDVSMRPPEPRRKLSGVGETY